MMSQHPVHAALSFPPYFLFDLDVGRAWKTSPTAGSISGGDLYIRHFCTNKQLLARVGEEVQNN